MLDRIATLRQMTQVDELANLKVGRFSPWFNHAGREIVRICRSFVHALQTKGLVVETDIALKPYLVKHRYQLAHPTRIRLALSSATSSLDYLQTQRIRSRVQQQMN